MAINKEDVYQALFTRLSGSLTGVNTISRKLRHFNDIDRSAQPAVFVHQSGAELTSEANRPPKQTIRAEVYVYVFEEDEDGPSPTINSIVYEIEQALERKAQDPLGDAQGSTTLGRAVTSARVTGIDYSGDSLGAQGIAILSIEMILPT